MTAELRDDTRLPDLSAGLVPDLPEDTYLNDWRALSQSDAKLILRAPALYKWRRDHPEPERKDAFDYGSAAHRLVLGVGPRIAVIEVEVQTTREGRKQTIIADTWQFKAAQEARDQAHRRGEIPLLPADFRRVQDMADVLSTHQLAMELLSEGRPEVSAYAIDPDTEVAMRGRFDWLGAHVVTDYKTSTTAQPDEFVRRAINYGYDLQLAYYMRLAELCGHSVVGFAHIVQEKDPPFLVTVVVLPPDLVDRGHRLRRRALEMYRDCTEAGRWPGYVPDTEFATPAAPAWVLNETP